MKIYRKINVFLQKQYYCHMLNANIMFYTLDEKVRTNNIKRPIDGSLCVIFLFLV